MNAAARAMTRPEWPRGSSHYKAKFSDVDVVRIRKLRSMGLSYGELSRIYEARSGTIMSICRGYSYADVDGPIIDERVDVSLRRKLCRARLTDEEVARIRILRAKEGLSYSDLAKMFSASIPVIQHVCSGRSYADVGRAIS